MDAAINLAAKPASFSDHGLPRTVAQFNGHDIIVVRVENPFVWHHPPDTDDVFLVLRGSLDIEPRPDRHARPRRALRAAEGGWSTGQWRGRKRNCC